MERLRKIYEVGTLSITGLRTRLWPRLQLELSRENRRLLLNAGV